MNKTIPLLALLTGVILVLSSCMEESTVSLPSEDMAENNNTIVTCSDFATPTPPGGASTVPLLIVRIQFEGDPFDDSFSGNPYEYNSFYSDACTWAKKIFYNAEEGQLNHYFNAVSYNNFHLEPASETHDNDNSISDGIITVTMSGNHPNPQSSGLFHSYLSNAIDQADAYIDFSSYDNDSDGTIEINELQVMYLVAGYESATTTSAAYHGVWAHKWCVSGQEGVPSPTADGVTLLSCSGNGYSRFGERHTSSGYDATIGVIAHELGHAIFDLPDLYDIDGSSYGIGSFGLMGYGSWGYESGENSGETPVHPSAWVKAENGWVTVDTQTTGNQNVDLYDTAQSNYNIIKVDIPSDTNQYFLLENRGTTSYDKGLYVLGDIESGSSFQGGIAIWHIDEGQASSSNIDNSDETRKLVDLEEAADVGLDSKSHLGYSTNLFYAGNGPDPFDDASTPVNTKDYDSANTGISVYSFPARSSTMNIDITVP